MSRPTYMRTRPNNKYGNKKTEADGITFDSKKEAKRYAAYMVLCEHYQIHDEFAEEDTDNE